MERRYKYIYLYWLLLCMILAVLAYTWLELIISCTTWFPISPPGEYSLYSVIIKETTEYALYNITFKSVNEVSISAGCTYYEFHCMLNILVVWLYGTSAGHCYLTDTNVGYYHVQWVPYKHIKCNFAMIWEHLPEWIWLLDQSQIVSGLCFTAGPLRWNEKCGVLWWL